MVHEGGEAIYSVGKKEIAIYMHIRTYTIYQRIIKYVCTKRCTISVCIKRKAHPHQEDSVSQAKHSIGQLELLWDVAHYR